MEFHVNYSSQVVTILLDRGATVDHQDKDGMTPLLVAAFEGHRDVCDLLLEYDADMDHCDVTGRTPLWAAASMGHGSVVKLLLYWGCCVDTIDNEGRTVLSIAAAQGGTDVVKQLLARGDISLTNEIIIARDSEMFNEHNFTRRSGRAAQRQFWLDSVTLRGVRGSRGRLRGAAGSWREDRRNGQ